MRSHGPRISLGIPLLSLVAMALLVAPALAEGAAAVDVCGAVAAPDARGIDTVVGLLEGGDIRAVRFAVGPLDPTSPAASTISASIAWTARVPGARLVRMLPFTVVPPLVIAVTPGGEAVGLDAATGARRFKGSLGVPRISALAVSGASRSRLVRDEKDAAHGQEGIGFEVGTEAGGAGLAVLWAEGGAKPSLTLEKPSMHRCVASEVVACKPSLGRHLVIGRTGEVSLWNTDPATLEMRRDKKKKSLPWGFEEAKGRIDLRGAAIVGALQTPVHGFASLLLSDGRVVQVGQRAAEVQSSSFPETGFALVPGESAVLYEDAGEPSVITFDPTGGGRMRRMTASKPGETIAVPFSRRPTAATLLQVTGTRETIAFGDEGGELHLWDLDAPGAAPLALPR